MTASLDGKLNVGRFLPLWSFSIIPLVATYSPSALCQYLVHEFPGQYCSQQNAGLEPGLAQPLSVEL